AGALAGIAGSAAAPSKSSKAKARSGHSGLRFRGRHFGPPLGVGPGLEFRGPPVHGEMVVPNANGDGFDTITMDSGKLKAIDGTKLTVTEGTDKATYGEPAIDVGSDATIFRNHQKASLGDLKEGDFVHIVQGPKGTLVWAESADFRAQEQKDRDHHFGHRWGGPPPGPPPGGVPRGGYPPSGA